MAELARGTVTDRPWGQTLGALAARRLTGQVTVSADGKSYCIAFAQGAVAGATSPLASDAAVRVALTGGLVSSTQVADITRRLAAAPNRDEIEVLAEAARLAPDQAARLRRRLVAQRASRTFSIDRGDFVITDLVNIPVIAGSELDVRAVIFLGAKGNLTDERLGAELDRFGGWFKLKPEAVPSMGQYGFTDADKPVLKRLLEGQNLQDLERDAPEVGVRSVRAIVYALASTGACEMGPVRPTPGRVTREAIAVPTPAGRQPAGTPPAGTPTVTAPAAARTKTSSKPPPGTENVVRMRSPTGAPPMSTAPLPANRNPVPASSRAKRNTQATRDTEVLIRDRVAMLDSGVDHFALLGVGQDAAPEAVRDAYFSLARKLHPDRLASLGIVDVQRAAQRLFAQINAAFAVLNDPGKRAEYTGILARGGETVVRAEEAKADEMALRVMQAEEAYRRGEMALRRNQLEHALAEFTKAIELQPSEAEYQAMFTWVKFATAPDKNAVAAQTRQELQRAADQSGKNPTARFYLGRVERILGREREALAHFQEVLRLKPTHTDAASEVRVLESRLKGKR
jgi:hypothetical protein